MMPDPTDLAFDGRLVVPDAVLVAATVEDVQRSVQLAAERDWTVAPENWAKLQQIIAARDPEGRFHRHLAADHGALNVNHWERGT